MRRNDGLIKDWASLNANAKHSTEDRMVAMKNWENKADYTSAGMTQHMKMRDVARMAVLKTMYENNLDVLVNPTITVPPAKIGFATQPSVNDRPLGRFPTAANLGIPEMTVPAGFNTVIYEPSFTLSAAKDNYVSTANETTASTLAQPMPVGMSFWSGPGEEPTILKVAAAYEAATKHRKPPPAFGPLKNEP
jgi:Asp-tRNA(Asn)/Glu-tRNA(Gln) amidotransferase A subunit family amidase